MVDFGSTGTVADDGPVGGVGKPEIDISCDGLNGDASLEGSGGTGGGSSSSAIGDGFLPPRRVPLFEGEGDRSSSSASVASSTGVNAPDTAIDILDE